MMWLNIAPVGLEFGSPHFERHMNHDLEGQ